MMTKQEYHDPNKFRDPLKDYGPPTYRDELERALAEETVASIRAQPFVCIAPVGGMDHGR